MTRRTIDNVLFRTAIIFCLALSIYDFSWTVPAVVLLEILMDAILIAAFFFCDRFEKYLIEGGCFFLFLRNLESLLTCTPSEQISYCILVLLSVGLIVIAHEKQKKNPERANN